MTNIDIVVDEYVERIVKEYSTEYHDDSFRDFIDNKCLKTGFFNNYSLERNGIKRVDVIKKFVDRGYLVSAETVRKKLPDILERPYVYNITDEFLAKIKKEADPGETKENIMDRDQLSFPFVAIVDKPCP